MYDAYLEGAALTWRSRLKLTSYFPFPQFLIIPTAAKDFCWIIDFPQIYCFSERNFCPKLIWKCPFNNSMNFNHFSNVNVHSWIACHFKFNSKSLHWSLTRIFRLICFHKFFRCFINDNMKPMWPYLNFYSAEIVPVSQNIWISEVLLNEKSHDLFLLIVSFLQNITLARSKWFHSVHLVKGFTSVFCVVCFY